MDLTHVIVVLIVVGVLLWLVNTYIPMAGSIKSILNAVVIIVVVLWLLQGFWAHRRTLDDPSGEVIVLVQRQRTFYCLTKAPSTIALMN